MPRQRRASPMRSSPARSAPRAASPTRRAAPPASAQRSNLPAAAPPAAVGQPVASQGPGLMAQMAATAGGVAIGSAVGHTVGHALSGAFGSSGGEEQAVAPVQQQEQSYGQPQRPIGGGMCEQEFQQFIRCTQEQPDISLCSGYNELLKECKMRGNAM